MNSRCECISSSLKIRSSSSGSLSCVVASWTLRSCSLLLTTSVLVLSPLESFDFCSDDSNGLMILFLPEVVLVVELPLGQGLVRLVVDLELFSFFPLPDFLPDFGLIVRLDDGIEDDGINCNLVEGFIVLPLSG